VLPQLVPGSCMKGNVDWWKSCPIKLCFAFNVAFDSVKNSASNGSGTPPLGTLIDFGSLRSRMSLSTAKITVPEYENLDGKS